MSPATPLRRRLLRVLGPVLASAALLLPFSAAAAHAADPTITLGAPTARDTFNESITFTVPITTSSRLNRVELRLRFPDSIGPFIVTVGTPAPGAQTLHYTLDITGDGHIVPNTVIVATWMAYASADAPPVASAPMTFRYVDDRFAWKTVTGDIVAVHWYSGPESFARKALAIGEQAIRDTSTLLGVTETQPIDFYIYGDEAAFRDALGPGTRENVGGQALPELRTLFTFITPAQINDPWVGIVVPHELTHLVFETAVRNPFRSPPRWLNEGLAVYLSQGYDSSDRGLVADAVRSGDLLPLSALGSQFPTEPDKTSLAYAESVSAIDYLVRTKDKATLVNLVLAYRDGLTDDEAFTRVLGVDVAGFQQGWLASIGAKTPIRFGPQPEPSGPVPPGWDAAVPGDSPSASTAPSASTPGSTAVPSTGGDAGSGGDMTVVLLAIVVVSASMLAGLVLAGRRAAAP